MGPSSNITTPCPALQCNPLGAHAFLEYKPYLRTAYQRARLLTADGQLSVAQFLAILWGTVRAILQGRRWAVAFDQDGFGQLQAQLTPFILRQLELDAPPVLPALAPAAIPMGRCFPRNSAVPAAILLRPYRQAALPAQLPAPPLVRAPALPVGRPLVIRRPAPAPVMAAVGPVTRGQSRLAAALARGRPLPRPAPPRPLVLRPPTAKRQGG